MTGAMNGTDPTRPDFTVLTVCTGNICRSPLAEQYLRAGLAGIPEIELASAGTMAVDGDLMPDQAVSLARSYGADPSRHRARFLYERDVSGAGLVLALAREHRRAVVAMHPRASRTTFTLREFARLSAAVTDEEIADVVRDAGDVPSRLALAVAYVGSMRGTVDPPESPLDDDVVDPYRRADDVFAESGRQLVPAADEVVRVLRAAAAGGAR